jgi:HEAT repeat protein
LSDGARIAGLIRQLGSRDWQAAAEAQKSLVRIGRSAVPQLCDALEGDDFGVAWRAAWVLGRVWDRRALPSLCRVLAATSELAQRDSREWLNQWGDPERRGKEQVQSDQRALLRVEIVDALRLLGDPGALPQLCAALRDAYPNVRQGALNALAHIGAPAAPGVAACLVGLPDDAAVPAARFLAEKGDESAIRPLCELLQRGSWKVRLAAIDALAALSHRCRVPELRAALPELKRLARPWNLAPEIVQSRAAGAMQQIEKVTRDLQDLPLTAGSPASRTETLPRPSLAARLSPAALPLAADRQPTREPEAQEESPEGKPWLRRLRELLVGGPGR